LVQILDFQVITDHQKTSQSIEAALMAAGYIHLDLIWLHLCILSKPMSKTQVPEMLGTIMAVEGMLNIMPEVVGVFNEVAGQ
jgi:hypothetical protein